MNLLLALVVVVTVVVVVVVVMAATAVAAVVSVVAVTFPSFPQITDIHCRILPASNKHPFLSIPHLLLIPHITIPSSQFTVLGSTQHTAHSTQHTAHSSPTTDNLTASGYKIFSTKSRNFLAN